jgi:hypothetical protein
MLLLPCLKCRCAGVPVFDDDAVAAIGSYLGKQGD